MDNVYTLEDLKNANLIVRREYEDKFIELQTQINDLQAVISILSSRLEKQSSVNRGISQIEEPRGSTSGFTQLSLDQLQALEVMYNSDKISDWDKNFVNSIMTYKRISDKQKPILKRITEKFASSGN